MTRQVDRFFFAFLLFYAALGFASCVPDGVRPVGWWLALRAAVDIFASFFLWSWAIKEFLESSWELYKRWKS